MSASRKTIAVLGAILLVATLSGCANDEGDDDRTPSIPTMPPSPTETTTPHPRGTVDAYWGIIGSKVAEDASDSYPM
jgi:hypothetical protein